MRIGILLHRNAKPLDESGLFIRHLVSRWRAQGLQVEVLHGTATRPRVDLLIPQIDLTVRPARYHRFVLGYERVVNRNLADISKRHYSSQLLEHGTPWNGPVIIKTDRNCGGRPEATLRALSRRERIRNLLRYRVLRRTRPEPYTIYESLDQVPREVFLDHAYIVEKFVPEQEGDLYFLRNWLFFGDRGVVLRIGSRRPVVKGSQVVIREEPGREVPEELQAFRERWSIDYAKIDFVMHQGRPVILDVNPTPTSSRGPSERIEGLAAILAGGLPSLVGR
ncbi:MAG TPA: hypothetical protein VM534_10555 [Thermoanaerobaculia bacterium]|nr:hypothetical protein [Thermoanaerobaculia bacterium]